MTTTCVIALILDLIGLVGNLYVFALDGKRINFYAAICSGVAALLLLIVLIPNF